MSGNHGDLWFTGEVEFTSSTVYQLVFESEVGSGERSDIAIDDVAKRTGPCADQGEITQISFCLISFHLISFHLFLKPRILINANVTRQ